ncbi:sulfurtransferase [Psychromarinibacter halotolerans]|uniref:Sulfurtransferase n=1 Tax=Psychromarinibacter halotolerans TaxID=1775175 RepID=A0ABV7GXI2_9RHOB|nr:sulfurtransferase [Psychromarinibacter halotolerans]MDF0597611.1 sulfurtransferase [Psychromarinibacter halotolerans]
MPVDTLAPDPLISVEDARALHQAGRAQFVDATYFAASEPGNALDSYRESHLPGAAFFDIEAASRADTDLPHMLPDAAAFEAFARSAGLAADKTLIVYDRIRLRSAPRVWWTLEHYGHRSVKVLDGGLEAWVAAGHPVESGPPDLPPGDFRATDQARIATLDHVLKAAETGHAQILDARPSSRFSGADGDNWTQRKGHIRGSKSVPAGSLLTPEGSLRPTEDLTALLAPALDDRPIITTCGSGIAAAIIALAARVAGRTDVTVYDGSWAEWGRSDRTEHLTDADTPSGHQNPEAAKT